MSTRSTDPIKQEAHRILDDERVGIKHSGKSIRWALIVLGDLNE